MDPDRIVPIVMLVLAPLFWCWICWMFAGVGGWYRLAERFRSGSTDGWAKPKLARVRFGIIDYLAKVIVTDLGIHISVRWMMFHPPVFIPWTELRNARPKYIWFVQADVANPSIGTIRLPRCIVEGYLST